MPVPPFGRCLQHAREIRLYFDLRFGFVRFCLLGVRMKKCFILILVLSAAVFGQSGGQFQITRSVISNGGTRSSGGNFALEGTIGQALTSRSTGSGFEINSGFWKGGGTAGVINRTPFDYDGDGR